jgi:hypothetical protein
MKKTVSLLLAVLMAGIGFAQQRNIPPTYNNNNTDESPSYESGFKKENLFLGGNIALGFGTYSFNIGVNPEIGYSVSKWLDAGVGVNLNYNSQTYDYGTYQTKYKNFNYGGGVFARAWAFPFLFFQVQPEMNWIQSSASSTGATSNSGTFQSTSLLAGIGYGSRMVGSHYSYITLMVDVLNDVNSPYRDYYGNAYPIFRAGFGFYLHPSRKR